MQRSLKLLSSLLLAAAATACATADESPPPSEETPEAPEAPAFVEKGPRWISIGADALETAQMALDEGRRGRVLTPLQVTGDVAILSYDAEDFESLSELMHVRHNRCGGFMVHESLEEAEAALRAKDNESLQSLAVSYTIDNAATVNGLLPELQEPRIRAFIESLSAFQNRYYTSTYGTQSSNFIYDQWLQIAASRPDITVARFTHSWAQSSIIVTIPGSTLASEVVIIGGHQDSIAPGNATSVAPGADDDASGIATITEVLRALVAKDYRPLRTVKIMAYAAEEVGLRGSGAIAADHVSRGINVVGVAQFDMTNFKGSTSDIYLMQDYTNAAQNTFVRNLITTYTTATVDTDSCGYGCSDHASWHNRGIPASMPFESRMSQYNSTIHSSNDRLSVSGGNANHALKFARLGVAYVAELAKGTLGGGQPGNQSPTVLITAPATGSTVQQAVTLTGTASDPEDGNLASSIRWSSNVAGTLGTGASLAVNLAAGAHTLTASVTDSSGLSATTSVNVTVASPGGNLFSDNFEGALGWTCASPGYSSAVSSLYYGRDATCNYSTGARTQGTATSAAFSGVASTSRLSFKFFRSVETISGNYDIASVQIVPSSGTATTVWTRNSASTPTTTWQDSGLISLAAYAGQTIRLRFQFDSVDSTANNFTGWLIDDVVVTR
jgi:leucyl aminopeptidase